MLYTTEYESPFGNMILESDGSALTGLRFAPVSKDVNGQSPGCTSSELPIFRQATAWLDAYFAGENPSNEGLPLKLLCSSFSKLVLDIVSGIPYGQWKSYGEIAQEIRDGYGRPASPRAVGTALARNPLLIVIPCHRVLGAGGKLTGYAGGISIKFRLLLHENLSFTAPE